MRRIAGALALFLGVLLLMFFGVSVGESFGAKGAKALRIVVTDLVGERELHDDFDPLARELGDILGRKVCLVPVTSRIEAVKLMRDQKVDFVLTGPAEYVVIRKLTEARPVIGLHRIDYYSVIVARADGRAASIENLRGEKVAMGSIGSTSSHLAPMQLLSDSGLDPRKDARVVHADLDKAWRALVRGNLLAAGMSSSKFTKYRDAEKKTSKTEFKVLVRGPDLPGDVFVAAAHVTDVWVSDMRKAFMEQGERLKNAILQGKGNSKYKGMTLSVDVRDEEYDMIRKMYATAGFPAYSSFLGD